MLSKIYGIAKIKLINPLLGNFKKEKSEWRRLQELWIVSGEEINHHYFPEKDCFLYKKSEFISKYRYKNKY